MNNSWSWQWCSKKRQNTNLFWKTSLQLLSKSNLKIPAFYIIIANFSWRYAKFQIQSASLWFIQERYIILKIVLTHHIYYFKEKMIAKTGATNVENIKQCVQTIMKSWWKIFAWKHVAYVPKERVSICHISISCIKFQIIP